MAKSTAMMLQVSTAEDDNHQQIVAFATKAVYRRAISTETRTRWRHSTVPDMTDWVGGYVTLTKDSPVPMDVKYGPVLIEVTDEEVTEASSGSFPRNVGLRFQRVCEAMDAEPKPDPVDVRQFMDDWQAANVSDDNAWLDRHIHTAGTAREPVAAPKAPKPEPVVIPAVSSGWTYPATVGGYIARPNGSRYKVRKIEDTTDVAMIRESRPEREHVFLYGEPGTGKTALVEAAFGTDLVTMLGTEDTEVSDFLGGYTTRGGGTYGWTDGALVEAMERGVPLFIDEIGVIFPKVLTTTFSVMDGRDEIRITANPDRGIVKAKPGFMVLAATNPHAPGVRLSEALLSRFGLHMEVTTDYAVMRDMGVPNDLVTAAENIEKRRSEHGTPSWAPQARELLRAKRQIETRGKRVAIRNMIGSAPEDDRKEVGEMLGRATGVKVGPLRL